MRERLPESRAVLQVYAVIAVIFAGWTITAFLWKLSAWVLLLNLGEIFTIFSYAMTANFLESLIILLLLMAACVVLPPRLLRDDFIVRGTVLAIGLIGALIAFVGFQMRFGIESGAWLFMPPFFVLILTGILLRSSTERQSVRSIASWVSDRLLVFLFLLLPLFVLLSLYIVMRNIAWKT
jgi:hypothetical protein